MKQLSQKLKSGEMRILDFPIPHLDCGMVLVRNHYSLISAGTEGSTADTARKSLIGKAKERPQQVKQVIDVLKNQGPVQTYRAVMKKLDAHSQLGYSCVGEIIDFAGDVFSFRLGENVACAGLTACHAEVVAVPSNLCVRLPENTDLKQATYNTLGSIALQGVRQADLRLGETCAVIGLGLLGQLTCMLLQAAGIRVVGVDVNPDMVKLAGDRHADMAVARHEEGIESKIMNFTDGLGCDAVVIAAATDSLDPVNFAGAIARKRGTLVVVGAVPTGFDREPHYYKKELQLRMSCSYGPGRYDPIYEEKGVDYPPGYVRWTENRNMQAFQGLIATGKIDVSHLTTHVFKLADAPKAYDMIVNKSEPFVGILIEYDSAKEFSKAPIQMIYSDDKTASLRPATVSVAFIGAGSYAQSHLLPNLPTNDPAISFQGVMTNSGATSRRVAEKFGFSFCCSEEKDIFENEKINTVFIATRHDSHAGYVFKALTSGKTVFVEKPLCLNMDELNQIADACQSIAKRRTPPPQLMVGYNRRFAPLALSLKEHFSDGPKSMIYRINAGAIPKESWIQDREFGGGRIIGEACHFIDFLTFMAGAPPTHVHAAALPDPHGLNDTVSINLSFADGSIGTVCYFANGSKKLPKEYIEIHQNGISGVLTDFKELRIHGQGKPVKKKLFSQDKGQKDMVRSFIDTIKSGGPPLIPFEQIARVSQITFAALDSIRNRQAFGIDRPVSAPTDPTHS